MTKVLDIAKIQKTVRKSIKDYAIAGNHEEEALIVLISADLYFSLNAEDVPPPPSKSRPKQPVGPSASPSILVS